MNQWSQQARTERVNINAVRAPEWISAEVRELDRIAKMPEGRDRSLAFEALYHSYRKRCGMTYEAEIAAQYENRDMAHTQLRGDAAGGGLYDTF